jgi:hypothetical protein
MGQTMKTDLSTAELWPALPWEEWKDTAETLHMWMQIVGKTRLALTPRENHWWNVPLYLTPGGLTTSAIPYRNDLFDLEFDLIDHQLVLRSSTGKSKAMALRPQSVAAFYREYLGLLREFQIDVKLRAKPVEVADPIPFAEDERHASYDSAAAHRFWVILRRSDTLFKRFRARFIGKSSPVHFFWGSFDLAVTRFSGRPAPPRPGADSITREAYSHEVISAGFWPGNGGFGTPAFYCYAAPEPPGLAMERIRPTQAAYNTAVKEFILLYDDVRKAQSPDDAVMDFLQSSFEAAANLAQWNRKELERPLDFVATTADGLLFIHGLPPTLSWVPRDAENGAYNAGGIITVGTLGSVDEAKDAARERYGMALDGWRISDVSPLDSLGAQTENHVPEIEGHKLMRHDIHWK